ncbi:endonuclease domain-containing 1 protein-like [Megalobrama amblycephala]|uniref:endonuclease domain-containing 1 protein-like n=1 Tax=Megalobrama amblycephala TaxID=75352 RepID=UPI0020145504|nr:endonuclease domain-containing 1 protein-like [Megalobrama amblycephala]
MKLLVFLLLPYLSLSEVGKDFSKCRQFFLNNDPPQITLPADVSVKQVKHICQCLKDKNKIKYLYATLYNTAWRIPIYSAYVFGSPNVERVDRWYIEPQLDLGTTAEPCMSPQDRDSIINQAVNCDYVYSGYDRGHLYPVQHTNNHLSMLATSTLTNAAPQDPTFNQQEWKKHEKAVIDDLKGCKGKAYVVTGVVPDINKQIPKRNPIVTVSKYYWRANWCLKNNKVTEKGYFGPDNNGRVEELSIAKLQEKLEKYYNIIIFPSVPPRAQKTPGMVVINSLAFNL